MKKKLYFFISKLAITFCSIAITIVGFTSQSCRAQWFQPKEPDNLDELLGKR